MTISFFNPDEVPQPKEKIKIEHFAVNVQPDRRRVQVTINVTPFLVRPNLAVVLLRDTGADSVFVGDMTIIETMHNKMEFMMHVRGADDPAGNYILRTRLYFEEGVHQPYDEAELAFEIPTKPAEDD
ncbi:MAG TPA: hypothetical protein VJZ27_17320 [Aggregatilineales bacterium]|nr:hypothetical protein [Aggregatilineales bacterium]